MTYPTDVRDWWSYYSFWDPVNSNSYFSLTRVWNHTIDIAAADLTGSDADGRSRDEIVLTSEGTLYVLGSDFSDLATLDIPMLSGASSQILRVEAGDLDKDWKAEIVVSNGSYDDNFTAQISVYRLGAGNALEAVFTGRAVSSGSTNLRVAEIAIGNVVGDGSNEVVLSGLLNNSLDTIGTLVMAFSTSTGTLQDSFLNVSRTDDVNSGVHNFWSGWLTPRAQDAAVPILALADMDGDGLSEIVAGDDILSLTQTATAYSLDFAFATTGDEALRRGLPAEYLPGWGGIWGNRAPDTAFYNQVKAGDLDGDGLAEIVALDFMKNKLRVYRYNKETLQIEQGTPIAITGGNSPFLCLADLDEDGLVLEYIGHKLEFTEPLIVAVMASPPYWDKKTPEGEDIQYNLGNMGTTFGVTAGASAGAGATFSASGGVFAGAEGTVPLLGNGKAKTKHTVSLSVDVDFDLVASAQASYTLTGSAGDNFVVFTAVPIDYYCYKVLQADGSQNAEGDPILAGDILTVSLPRSAVLHATTVGFFNANNGKLADIDQTILGHTIGNPRSYMSKQEAEAKLSLNPMSYLLYNVGAGITGEGALLNEISFEDSLSAGVEVVTKLTYTNETEVSFIGLAGFT